MRTRTVRIGDVRIGGKNGLALVAGPCVIESREGCLAIAKRLASLAKRRGIPLVFKASYDKANRSSIDSYRGPGIEEGLAILAEVKKRYGLPVLTDVHSVEEVAQAARVADVLQIPAFLCRQTDLLVAAGETGRPVNVKKGQFLAPEDVGNIVDKVERTGNRKLLLTERGASFGYHNLVADMRSLIVMREFGCPVIFDATHSVQRPGGGGDHSGGDGKWAPALARGAVAVGCDAVFMETHVAPEQALSDSANSIPFGSLGRVWDKLDAIDRVLKSS